MAHAHPSKDTHLDNSLDHLEPSEVFYNNVFEIYYKPEEVLSIVSSWIYTYKLHINMNTTEYWPMAREYSVWNAAIAALQI